MKIGDRVKDKKTGRKGTIKDIEIDYVWYNSPGDEHYIVDFDKSGTKYCFAADLELIQSPLLPKGRTGCECGVDTTNVGGKHSEWCPLSYLNEDL